MSTPFIDRRLGKRPAKHDPRTYRLGPVLAERLPAVPAERDWSQNVPYQMWGNDRFGCCAFAAQAAHVATWTKAAQGLVMLSTDMVLANYADVTGFDPATGTNDNGTVLLDELNKWRTVGFQRPGQTRDYLTAFGSIQPTDTASIKRGIAFLGGVLAGVIVPQGFLSLPIGGTWDLSTLSGPDLTPAGGHAIALVGYNPEGVFFNTWGARTFMPWATFTQISDEAYGLLSRENWLGVPGMAPTGEGFEALLAEIRAA
ncbi:C1 family peptidase [Gluconobacter sphaericus]|uniref:Uncharacterized protein n=1 Tax=Gluconobacter sphaericus NBRC 12467 TaxID=1307951 RepID=A0AA37SJT5_9PROT|nr:hypothetical protein [Gluconobacter sphaericus]MBF0885562.1 hypothetical protein [Gluconobacter sphaericus]GBR56553.1 hypothetical protein AA12467_2666 [Gluconobacter sphaericus NBRC 12467]GEB43686.1 hypothetical protein GSP01_24680 [Gluconobacter sphaericus NBRC 12467]GLQ86314.1 hypothetical protein GCM10007872_32290 [Gluconobacter sphaericus NBRC 12467]